jgi:uncharacterized protein (TIGR02186 family)
MKGAIAVILCLIAQLAGAESLVTGVSRDNVQITADFTGSDILVYGAVRRESPAPKTPLDVVVTLEGPSSSVIVRRKQQRFGIWVNGPATELADVPSYFAIASTGPLAFVLSANDNWRHKITLDRRVNVTKVTAESMDFSEFSQAVQRIGAQQGAYLTNSNGVQLAQETLFRADFVLPANLIEGDYRLRMFLLRRGQVIDVKEQSIDVHKAGIERYLTNMAEHQPLLYGIVSLLMAALAGWAASETFRLLRR